MTEEIQIHIQQQQSGTKMEVVDAINDLCCRFIINAPEEELQNAERIMYLVEEAHWFYMDFYQSMTGVHLGQREFASRLKSLSKVFEKCPILKAHAGEIDGILRDFEKSKKLVPVNGAVLLNSQYDKCLLVNTWDSHFWGFPKGKINKDEKDSACAIREVLEETGFDISSLINPENYIELLISGQRNRLFIVGNVPETTKFKPQTRGEIAGFAWVNLNSLPTNYQEAREVGRKLPGRVTSTTIAFVPRLKLWLKNNQQQQKQVQSIPKIKFLRRRVQLQQQKQEKEKEDSRKSASKTIPTPPHPSQLPQPTITPPPIVNNDDDDLQTLLKLEFPVSLFESSQKQLQSQQSAIPQSFSEFRFDTQSINRYL